jgi:hypothetical protein
VERNCVCQDTQGTCSCPCCILDHAFPRTRQYWQMLCSVNKLQLSCVSQAAPHRARLCGGCVGARLRGGLLSRSGTAIKKAWTCCGDTNSTCSKPRSARRSFARVPRLRAIPCITSASCLPCTAGGLCAWEECCEVLRTRFLLLSTAAVLSECCTATRR